MNYLMNTELFEQVWPVFMALSFIAGLAFLRVLSIMRSREISTYDVARKAAEMRRNYEEMRRKEEEGEVIEA